MDAAMIEIGLGGYLQDVHRRSAHTSASCFRSRLDRSHDQRCGREPVALWAPDTSAVECDATVAVADGPYRRPALRRSSQERAQKRRHARIGRKATSRRGTESLWDSASTAGAVDSCKGFQERVQFAPGAVLEGDSTHSAAFATAASVRLVQDGSKRARGLGLVGREPPSWSKRREHHNKWKIFVIDYGRLATNRWEDLFVDGDE